MISRIDHVSIAVRNYEKAYDFFTKIMGAVPGASGTDADLQFHWEIYSLGDLSRLELISPSGEKSFLGGFLKNRAGGVHHITLETPDIRAAGKRLDELGIPYFGYLEKPDEPWKELFIHPRDAFGVLIQIAEFNPDDWIGDTEKLTPGKRWTVEKKGNGAALTFSHPGGGKMCLNLDRSEIQTLIRELEEVKAGGDPSAL